MLLNVAQAFVVELPAGAAAMGRQRKNMISQLRTDNYDPSGDQHLIGSRDVLLGDWFARSR